MAEGYGSCSFRKLTAEDGEKSVGSGRKEGAESAYTREKRGRMIYGREREMCI